MKKQLLFILSSILLCGGQCIGLQRILLLNGYLHTGTEKTFETAAVGMENGKITVVRNALAFSYSKEDWDTIIDL